MKSLLHCLWTGSSFPYSLRRYIKNWGAHLRKSKSEFDAILTEDSLCAFENYIAKGCIHYYNWTNWRNCFAGIDVDFLDNLKFFMARLEPLLSRFHNGLAEIFRSLSNIGRLLSFDVCGGIYSDLVLNYERWFAKDIKIIMIIFKKLRKIVFYIDKKIFAKTLIAENQCLILFPLNIGAFLLNKGLLNNSYLISGNLTYDIVVNFFNKNVRVGCSRQHLVFMYHIFHDFFDYKQVINQFRFKNSVTQEHIGMFSWANLWFSRLINLEMETRYIIRKGLIEKKLLLDPISRASIIRYEILEPRSLGKGGWRKFQFLDANLRLLNRNFLPLKMVREALASLLVIVCFREGVVVQTNMGEDVLRKLNETCFKICKDLIDPEKYKLSYEDLENYILCNQLFINREAQQ